jgi:hypothetical protein
MKQWMGILLGALGSVAIACNGLTGADEIIIGEFSDDDGYEQQPGPGVGGNVASNGAGSGPNASSSTSSAVGSSTQSSSAVSASSSVSSSVASSSVSVSSSSSGQLDCLSDPNAKKATAYLCISGVD